MYKILEPPIPLPYTRSLILIYPCLNWIPQNQSSVTKAESTDSISSDVSEPKDHLGHKSPLAVVPNVKKRGWKRRFLNH